MAYMIGNDGPYPNKAGEWIQNTSGLEKMLQRERFRVGRPRSYTGTLSVPCLELTGMVGLYWKADQPMPIGATEVDAPELMEPPE